MSDQTNFDSNWYKISQDLNMHVNNGTMHVTQDDKTNWNAANTHINDTIKHITSGERVTWNAKSPAHEHPYDPSGSSDAVQSNLNTHVSNETVHITTDERTTWNNKAPSHNHPYDPTGAAEAVQTNLTSHISDSTKHITTEERDKWNANITTLANSVTANGYQKLPGGLVIQWGKSITTKNDNFVEVAFPLPFTELFVVTVGSLMSGDGEGDCELIAGTLTQSNVGVTFEIMRIKGDGNDYVDVNWIAIGKIVDES